MSDSQKKKKKWLIDLGVECVKLISFSILHQFKQMLLEKLIFWLTSMPNRPLVVLSIVKGYSYPLFLAPLWEHMWEMSSYLSISFDYIDSIIKWRKRKKWLTKARYVMHNKNRILLTFALRIFINKPFLITFYRKMKKSLTFCYCFFNFL